MAIDQEFIERIATCEDSIRSMAEHLERCRYHVKEGNFLTALVECSFVQSKMEYEKFEVDTICAVLKEQVPVRKYTLKDVTYYSEGQAIKHLELTLPQKKQVARFMKEIGLDIEE